MVISFESRKKSFPVYLLPAGYFLLAMLFQDRLQYAGGLLLAIGLFLGSYVIGKRLSFLIFKTADQSVYFPLGLGTVLAILYAGGHFTTERVLFYGLWGAILIFGGFELPVLNYRISRSYLWGA